MKIKTKQKKTFWKDAYWIKIYQYAQAGKSNKEIASIMGIDRDTLKGWLRKHPELKEEIDKLPRAGAGGGVSETPFRDYVYKRLDPKLKDLWDQINELETEESGAGMIDALLKNQGVRVRQNLFIHALICTNFNTTRACAKVGISHVRLIRWVENDPDFGELVAQVKTFKKDFFEEALVKLVASGDPGAIIHVNKTYNKDRGYNEKVDISVTNKEEGMLDIDDLNLPLEVRKGLLKALKEKNNPTPVIAAIESKPKEPKTINVDAKVIQTIPVKED